MYYSRCSLDIRLEPPFQSLPRPPSHFPTPRHCTLCKTVRLGGVLGGGGGNDREWSKLKEMQRYLIMYYFEKVADKGE